MINASQKRWGYTYFLFLDYNGNYITPDGKRGSIDIGSDINKLVNENEKVVTGGTISEEEALTVFAVPTGNYYYKDFEYSAIAIAYDTAGMVNMLSVESFDGQAQCYLTNSDGKFILCMIDTEKHPYNILSYIEKNGNLKKSTMNHIISDFEVNKKGNAKFTMNNQSYYLVYMPVEFQDWMLMSIVPQEVVNSNINKMHIVTVCVLCVIFLVIISYVVFILIKGKKQEVNEKDKEIKYREQLFDILVSNTDDIFIMFDHDDYEVEYVSSNIERVLGLNKKRIKDSIYNIAEISVDGKLRITTNQLKDIAIGECVRLERELKNCKTGELRWYNEAIYHTAIDDKQKYVLVLSDRTKERESSQHIQETLDIAKQANEAKSNFLSNMSHDIRTPMNAIVGLSSLLSMHAHDKGKVLEYTRKIKNASNHLLNLINDVLDMSKIESGNVSLNETKFSIEEMIGEISSVIRPQTRAKQQVLKVKRENLKHDIVYADKLRISQIMLNLLSNAVKYTDEHGKIIFTISESEEISNMGNYVKYCFTVKDNGIGMNKDYLKYVFDPFSRENESITNQIQGTGLGMAIAKNIVDLMDGSIEVESEVDKGSTFTVHLMLKVEENEELELEQTVAVTEEKISLEGINVLIAEDYKINADILVELLTMEGMSCDVVSDGKQAVDIFKTSKPGEYDIILMDIQMPVMHGYDATRAIRELDRDDAKTIPIAAMTANAFADDVQKALEAGMNAHVPKPIDIKVLCERIAELIKGNVMAG